MRRTTVSVMMTLFLVLGIGSFELHDHGWMFFVTRPPGVGSTPDDPSAGP